MFRRKKNKKKGEPSDDVHGHAAAVPSGSNSHPSGGKSPGAQQDEMEMLEKKFLDQGIDFDSIYDVDETDLGNMNEHGSVLFHLLSQVKIGMDLTKVTLPTFILERRSLLEMYADFFAHPDIFANIPACNSPEQRMIQVLRWYLSAFHAGRRSSVAKKPYNPIIGEIFRCHWQVPNVEPVAQESSTTSPFPGVDNSHVTFIAEQVSHHPPISACYAELAAKNLQFGAHVWTQSKFYGTSIGVVMVGEGCVSVLDHQEEYTLNFPQAYGRNILGTPWVELGGSCHITCKKTGYHAEVKFETKPLFSGPAHVVKASVFRPGSKSPFFNVKGFWNGVMHVKGNGGKNDEVFLDVNALPLVPKVVKKVQEMDNMESRRLWRVVTAALKQKDVDSATRAKSYLEKRQREEAKDRKSRNADWETKYFREVGEHYVYKYPLKTDSSSSDTS